MRAADEALLPVLCGEAFVAVIRPKLIEKMCKMSVVNSFAKSHFQGDWGALAPNIINFQCQFVVMPLNHEAVQRSRHDVMASMMMKTAVE
jgi:hypothetical protein